MKRLAPVCISVFCLLAVLAVPAMAASQAADQTSTPGHTQGRVLELLDKLQENGYDVSAIRTAIQNGDTETAKTLMEQFRTAHPDAFPSHTFMGKGRSSPQGTGSA